MINDSDILSMNRVTPQVAARYLGMSDDMLKELLKDGTFKFGTAWFNEKNGKWFYDIRPKALVDYNNNGQAHNINDIVDRLIERLEGDKTA